jgi:uncharacterized protein (TIGR02646 family)
VIFVDRNRLSASGRSIQPDDAWFERAELAQEAANREGRGHKFREALFRDSSARAALHNLFHRKCAYCEVSIPSRSGWSIDHFRPKGRVAERKDHSGYYWLAYRWFNLYLACDDCNKHLYDTPTFEDPMSGPAGGKLDQFPLADETTRAMSPDDPLDLEQNLLLDPCADQPEEHLRYDVEGEILAKTGDDRGESTIRVLHLTRKRLRDNRRRTVAAVVKALRVLRTRADLGVNAGLDEISSYLEGQFFGDQCEHAGVARFVQSNPDLFGL